MSQTYKIPATKVALTISGLDTAMVVGKGAALQRVYRVSVTARVEGHKEAYDIHAQIPFEDVPINATRRDRAIMRGTMAMGLLETMLSRILGMEVEQC